MTDPKYLLHVHPIKVTIADASVEEISSAAVRLDKYLRVLLSELAKEEKAVEAIEQKGRSK